MVTISENILIEKGYKKYLDNKFQKLIEHDSCKSYFINIDKTNGFDAMPNGFYWPSIQFEINVNGVSSSIHISLVQWFNNGGTYSGITVEKMEYECHKLFTLLKGEHYEDYRGLSALEIQEEHLKNRDDIIIKEMKRNPELIREISIEKLYQLLENKNMICEFQKVMELVKNKQYELAIALLF